MAKRTNLSTDVSEALQQILNIKKENKVASVQLPRMDIIYTKHNEVNLFSELDDKKEILKLSSGTTINEFTFTSLRFALYKAVSTQTQYKNNSELKGKPVIAVSFTISDLCKDAFGTPTPTDKQKEEMKSFLRLLDRTRFTITYNDGKGEVKKSMKYISIMDEEERKGVSTKYVIAVNGFLFNLNNGYGLLPQDFTYRLTAVTKRKTAGHYKLAEYIAIQKEKTITRYIATLVEELGYEAEYKEQKKRTEQKIINICEDLKKAGIIKNFTIEEGSHRKIKIETNDTKGE